MEMLIVIAIVAVLISVAVPVLSSQLERSREAVDLANVRSAYAQVSTEALLGKTDVTVTVNLKQKQAGWQSVDPVNIGGIVHSKSAGNTDNWKGDAEPDGTCEVSYNEAYGVVLIWSGTAAPGEPSYPFNTAYTNFFDDMLYINSGPSGTCGNEYPAESRNSHSRSLSLIRSFFSSRPHCMAWRFT